MCGIEVCFGYGVMVIDIGVDGCVVVCFDNGMMIVFDFVIGVDGCMNFIVWCYVVGDNIFVY